LARASITLKL